MLMVVQTNQGFRFGGYSGNTVLNDQSQHGRYVSDCSMWLYVLSSRTSALTGKKLVQGNVNPKPAQRTCAHSFYVHRGYMWTQGGGHDMYIASNFAGRNSYANMGYTYHGVPGLPAYNGIGKYIGYSNTNYYPTRMQIYQMV